MNLYICLTIFLSALGDNYCEGPGGWSHHAAVAVATDDVQYTRLENPWQSPRKQTNLSLAGLTKATNIT